MVQPPSVPSRCVSLAILAPPAALSSTLFGMAEVFQQATAFVRSMRDEPANGATVTFSVSYVVFTPETIVPPGGSVHQAQSPPRRTFDVVVACPSFGADHGPLPKGLVRWLHRQQQSRALLTSVCAGAFVLAAAGLLTGRRVTTHWALSEKLAHLYPDITVDSDQLIVDEGDLLTAAGTTAWLSLALRIVHRFAGASVVSALGKFYLVDTGMRRQQYYRVFSPRYDHGNESITLAQRLIEQHFASQLDVAALATAAKMPLRTFQRRFQSATGLSPQAYLTKYRVQRAAEYLERSPDGIEQVVSAVGYLDASAFRKAFKTVTGLSPIAYRKRFRLA